MIKDTLLSLLLLLLLSFSCPFDPKLKFASVFVDFSMAVGPVVQSPMKLILGQRKINCYLPLKEDLPQSCGPIGF